jgi:chorismate mutase
MLQDDLTKLRKDIDRIDHDIVKLLADRMDVVRNVGEYKKKHDIEPLALARWQQLLEEKIKLAEKHGLSSEFIKELYEIIHKQSLHIESMIKNMR